jgi:hypothetical protein
MTSPGSIAVTWPLGFLLGLLLSAAAALSGSAWAQTAATGERGSLAAWDKISSVLTHPRCLNCHQLNTPLQSDGQRVHVPAVVRGDDNMGVGPMRCSNCHSDRGNNQGTGVPGAPHWQLAPASMVWQGLATGDLCRMLKDPARNGNRAPQALVEHVETEPLVLWGWIPGGRREAVPLPHKDFVEQMKVWVAGGAACPP